MIHDDIGKALAAEEHRQGVPVGGDPDHCDRCWDAVIDQRRAECEHEEVVEIRTMQGFVRESCAGCGRSHYGGKAAGGRS